MNVNSICYRNIRYSESCDFYMTKGGNYFQDTDIHS